MIGDLRQASHTLLVQSSGPGFINISRQVSDWLASCQVGDGLLTVFICHTSASLTIQENADPDVQRDLMDYLDLTAPASQNYRHNCEGPDDMPAHIKTMLTSVSLSIPVQNGDMALGTWQGLYMIEHRAQPHRRKIALHFIGSL